MNKKRKILIIECSKLVSTILKKAFAESNYKIDLYEDEVEAFEKISDIKPDCIIINKQLGKITGAQFCALIKSSSYSDIPVIIYSADNERTDFLLANSGANEIVHLSLDSISPLLETVEKVLNSNNNLDLFDEENVEKGDIESPSICAIKSMEKISFYYNTMRYLFDFAPSVVDLNELTQKMLALLYSICDFDMAVLIYNQNPFMMYKTKVLGLEKKDTHDFLKICKSDFESNLLSAKNNSYNEEIIDIFPEEKDLKGEKFASYRCFPLIGDNFIGTIHLTSTKKNFFRNSVCDQILYFVEKASVMIDHSIKYKGVTESEKQMRSAFSKFVPIEIIDDLLSSEVQKNTAINEKRKVAILICDIRNFTTISEANEPENVVSFLNGYFTRMVEVIKKHGGTIDKFIGDAIMALFGAPVSYTDNAERALNAALEMTELLPQIDYSLIKIPDGLTFDIGTGIHYGEVIVGSIGCEDKSDYTVIGDSANLTSRLEGLTKIYGSKIIISKAVRDELKGDYNLLNVDTVRVKGKHKGVPIYRADLEPLPAKYKTNYSKGLSLYKSGAWNLALGYFEKAATFLENDKSTNLMIERCKEFIENPPDNWEGAISLTSK